MMSLSPFMIICGAFIAKVEKGEGGAEIKDHIQLMATATAEEAKKYAIAGGIAEEVLSSVRTVHAFNAQHHEVSRLDTFSVRSAYLVVRNGGPFLSDYEK